MSHQLQSQTELYRFAHHAMATEFQILIPSLGADEDYLERACQECFRDLDILESELSRYKEGSDISRINSLLEGQSTPVGMAAFDCLGLAKAMYYETEGAFDITVGPLMELWRGQGREALRQPSEAELTEIQQRVGSDLFELSDQANVYEVSVKKAGVSIDLGALGKGYGLDQMARKLEEWQIRSAILSAGESTIFCLGSPPATDSLSHDVNSTVGWKMGAGQESVCLCNQALSGSGFEVQGGHIMNTRSGRPLPIEDRHAWAVAPNAALADALSTSFLVMRRAEIEELCAKLEGVHAILPVDPV